MSLWLLIFGALLRPGVAAAAVCPGPSLAVVIANAQLLMPTTDDDSRKLAQRCPSESATLLQWRAFAAAMTKAAAAPLDEDISGGDKKGTGRAAILNRARAGDYQELLRLVDHEAAGFASSADSQLVLARVLTRHQRFARGRLAYLACLRLAPADDAAAAEYLYSFIWERRYADAAVQLDNAARWSVKPGFQAAVARGQALVTRLSRGENGGVAAGGATASSGVAGGVATASSGIAGGGAAASRGIAGGGVAAGGATASSGVAGNGIAAGGAAASSGVAASPGAVGAGAVTSGATKIATGGLVATDGTVADRTAGVEALHRPGATQGAGFYGANQSAAAVAANAASLDRAPLTSSATAWQTQWTGQAVVASASQSYLRRGIGVVGEVATPVAGLIFDGAASEDVFKLASYEGGQTSIQQGLLGLHTSHLGPLRAAAHLGAMTQGRPLGDVAVGGELPGDVLVEAGGSRSALIQLVPLPSADRALTRDRVFAHVGWGPWLSAVTSLNRDEGASAAMEDHQVQGRLPVGGGVALRLGSRYQDSPRPSPDYDTNLRQETVAFGAELQGTWGRFHDVTLTVDEVVMHLTDRSVGAVTREDDGLALGVGGVWQVRQRLGVTVAAHGVWMRQLELVPVQDRVSYVALGLLFGGS